MEEEIEVTLEKYQSYHINPQGDPTVEYPRTYREWFLARRRLRRSRRNHATRTLREIVGGFLRERDGPLCFWCRCDPLEDWELDHHVPVSKGGGNEFANLRLLCASCNHRKYNMMPEVFEKIMGHDLL